VGAAGCRTASTGSLAHNRPPQVRPQSGFDLEAFVTEHNQNASRIRSMEARPSIVVKMSQPGKRSREGKVDGKLALERPRNFKLELSHVRSTIADIGSNDERFWFWFSNENDKSVYVCDYADLGSTSLAVTYQPDWIAEALGLKEIHPDEAAQVKVTPAAQPGKTALSFPVTRTGGQAYSRLMIVDDVTHKVNEFRVFAPDGKTVIAQANIAKYRDLPLAGNTDPAAASESSCYVPENIVLEWKREHLALDVVLRDVKVNQFDPARRTALFVEPAPDGYAKVNVAELAKQRESDGATAVRETIPAPEPKTRVRLTPPLQIRGEKAAMNSRSPKQPARPPGDMLLPVLDLDVVGAPVPTAPTSPFERTATSATALATAPAMSMER
jgi:hypothetical protein